MKLVLIKPQSYKQTKKDLNLFCCKLLCKCGLRLALLLTFYTFIYNLISNRLLYAYYFVNMMHHRCKNGGWGKLLGSLLADQSFSTRAQSDGIIDGHSLNQVSGAILDGVKLIRTYSFVTKIDLLH